MKKIIRTATVSLSLDILLKGQLSFLNKHFEVIAVSGEDKHLEIVRTREGVKTLSIHIYREINILQDIISLWKLYWCFKKIKPQIVHSITPKAGLLSMIAGKMAGVPIRIHTFTGLIFPSHMGFKQKLLIKMDQLLCWCATNIYPEGQGVKSDLLNFNITKKPLKVLANGNINGIDTTHFSPAQVSEEQKASLRQELGISNNDFVFVFIGRLVGDKGINELVLSFKRLCERSEATSSTLSDSLNKKLLLVGPLEPELDPLNPSTLQEIQNNLNILTVGFQKDVRPYLAISHALAFPSYREGFPNVVMQAGAMGLPSIVTDINGCNEIIENGVNGLIIPAKAGISSSQEMQVNLQNAMQRFIEDPAYYQHLQQNARQMICDRYEQRVVWEAILAEYRLLGS